MSLQGMPLLLALPAGGRPGRDGASQPLVPGAGRLTPSGLFSHSFPEACALSSPPPSVPSSTLCPSWELGVNRCIVGQVTAKVQNGRQLWMAKLQTNRKLQSFGIWGFGGTAEGWMRPGSGFPAGGVSGRQHGLGQVTQQGATRLPEPGQHERGSG